MGKVVVLKEPRTRRWNIYALREAARLKKWFKGVYYSPPLKRLLVVFKPTPGTHINQLVFEEVGESVLEGSYRMLCIKGCGKCCAIASGAFILENEVEVLPPEEKAKVYAQPSYLVKTPGGYVRVYRLDTGPMGRCIFFDPHRVECTLESRHGWKVKPIICLITYCTLFAERGGELYVKTGYRVEKEGAVVMSYRRASEEEVKRIVERMTLSWRKGQKA